MILIGQYDPPFVRRVGIAMHLYRIAYEHRPSPGGTGEWQAVINNWYQNVFGGVAATPDVPLTPKLAEPGA